MDQVGVGWGGTADRVPLSQNKIKQQQQQQQHGNTKRERKEIGKFFRLHTLNRLVDIRLRYMYKLIKYKVTSRF